MGQPRVSLGSNARIPKAPSMLFDIELDESDAGCHTTEEMTVSMVEVELLRFLYPASDAAKKVTSDVEAFISRRPGSSSLGDIAHALTAKGYICRERRATGGGEGSVCLHNLRHTCLVVILPTPHDVGNNKFIVDATFVEQFEIAKPTDRYSRLLRCVPPVLVFPEDSICLLVQFLCVEMSSAFRAMGAVLPPWRKVDSMLSKWLPRQLEVGLAAGTPLEPNAAALPTQLQLEVPRFVLGKPDSDPPQLLMPQHKARSIATTSQRHVEPVRICGGFSNMRVAGLLP